MFQSRFDDDFNVADFFYFCGKFCAKFFANLRRNSSGAAVGDNSILVERAKIRARGDVAMFQFHSQTERLNDAATDLKFQRVITKKSEMAGTAAGRDAGRDGNHAALR